MPILEDKEQTNNSLGKTDRWSKEDVYGSTGAAFKKGMMEQVQEREAGFGPASPPQPPSPRLPGVVWRME